MKLFTQECQTALMEEIKDITKVQLPAIAEEIALARSHGDLRENAQYAAAKEKQRMAESRLSELEEVIATYSVFETKGKTFENVTFGATVELKFLDDNTTKTIRILSDYEADIQKNILSINAPIVKAILELEEGDEAEVTLGGKKREILIAKIS